MRWIVSFVLIVAVVVGGGFGYLYASAKTPEAWFRQQCMTDAHNRAESKQIATGEDIEKRVAAFREENQTLIECKDKARSLAVSFLSSHYDETRITMMVDACEPKYAHQIPSGISAELERGAVNAICREDAIRRSGISNIPSNTGSVSLRSAASIVMGTTILIVVKRRATTRLP
jgi:sialic acid synthase SpsE